MKSFLIVLLIALSGVLAACERDAPTREAIPPSTATPKSELAPSATPPAATLAPNIVPLPTLTPAATAQPTPSPNPPATATPVPVAPTATPAPRNTPATARDNMSVKIFMIAMEDNGRTGKKIGCNDSAVAVTRTIARTNAPLTAAYHELLSLHDHDYGQSGFYNALWSSRLSVKGITIIAGRATVNLTGQLSLGGVCDNPRVAAQLAETALQFPTVRTVDVLINGVPLEQLLSSR